MNKLKESCKDLKLFIIVGSITIVLVIVGGLNSNIENVIDFVCLVFFCIFVVAFVFLLSYFVIRKKLLLRKIDSKDLDIVKEYIKNKYHELDLLERLDMANQNKFSLCDEFDIIYDMASMFGEYKRLNYSKNNILKDEFINYVKKLDNKEVNNILDESMNVKEIIFKYYNSNGVWKK